VDFGIAKLQESATHTMTGTVLGTPAYMSYEQAGGMRSDELDARSDVYSLGVVAYEMLTGRLPFHSDTPAGYLRMHLMEEPPPLGSVEQGLKVSPAVEGAVMKALVKDRNQRYTSVLEFAQQLLQAAEVGSQIAAKPERQEEAPKLLPATKVAPLPNTTEPTPLRDTVAADAVPKAAPPSWQTRVASNWKKIAICASLVWILGGGLCALKFQSNRDLEEMNWCTSSISGPEYEKCLNDAKADHAKLIPEERDLAAVFAFLPVVLGWGFIFLVLFLIRWMSRVATANPSRRKWIGSHWKKLGIVASVVWILSMGVHSYNVTSDENSELAAGLKQDCVKEKEQFDYSKCLREADDLSSDYQRAATLKCGDTKDTFEDNYHECLEHADVVVAKELPGDLESAGAFAFVPLLLAWGFAYLLRFLVRRNISQLAATGMPQVRTISKSPGKMKFFVISGVGLTLAVTGVWYFLQRAQENKSPYGLTEAPLNSHEPVKGDVSSPTEAGSSKLARTVGPFALERTLSSGQAGGGSVAFSPDGETLASGTGSEGETVMLWDVASGTLRSTLSGHKAAIETVAFSPDGKLLASGSDDTKVKLWDVASGTLRKTLSGHSDGVFSVAFSPDGKLLASGSGDTMVKLWDVASGTLRKTLTTSSGVGEDYWVNSVAFSPDGKLLASASDTVKLWDVPSGALRRMVTGHTKGVTSVTFSPDGKLLASGSDDQTVVLVDVTSGKLKQTLPVDDILVRSVAFSPDGVFLASGGNNTKLWDVVSGNLRQTLAGTDRLVKSVAFSPDGKLLASGSEDKIIKLWRRRENVTGSIEQEGSVKATVSQMVRTPGEVRVNPKDGLKYVWIPPGTFKMGCSPGDSDCQDNEKPQHQVTLTKGYWLGQTPVTVGGYKRFAGATGRQMPPEPDFNHKYSMPMVYVDWDDAHDYCIWAGGRLPTEAEWEYAARAGSTNQRYAALDKVAWYLGNSGRQLHPVGEKLANEFGLHDMLGNAAEWVSDWFDENYYRNSLSQDPSGPVEGIYRVVRGGSWYGGPGNVRVSSRDKYVPTSRGSRNGFRCCGDVVAP
jgi:WD40 repeat protein